MARDKVAQVTVLGLSSQPVDQVKRGRTGYSFAKYNVALVWGSRSQSVGGAGATGATGYSSIFSSSFKLLFSPGL